MRKMISLLLVLALLLAAVSAVAEGTVLDGKEDRKIQIHPAGENEVEEGVSPTTGRNLAEVGKNVREGFTGLAVTGQYMPVLVQISNADAGIGYRAPFYGASADIIYQTLIYQNGGDRMTMLFSDVIPTYVGPVRSLRVTALRIRQEWDCAVAYFNFSPADIKGETARLKNLGLQGKFQFDGNGAMGTQKGARVYGLKEPNNAVLCPQAYIEDKGLTDYVSRNHAFKFTDEKPQGGDEATFVFVDMGGKAKREYNSRLEYDEETNTYFRYLTKDNKPVVYSELIPVGMERAKIDGDTMFKIKEMEPGEEIDFSNVIVQFVDYVWPNGERPVPVLVGTGNADYFMGGRHYAGVWKHDDDNSRTVYYGEDGNEIELQRGKTLVILCDISRSADQQISYE